MKENKDIIVEGFWDSLITKTKQGVLAVAGAVGSSKARGKLSASLLSDAMFQQWKEFEASTDSTIDSEDFPDFLRRIGFSMEFAQREHQQLNTFLHGHQPLADEPTAEPSDQPDGEETETPDDAPEATSDPDETPATPTPTPAADRLAARRRLRRRRSQGGANESLQEDVVSDGELRKFFDQMARRALKTGDARSAAQKSIKVNRLTTQRSTQAAPEAPQATPAQPQAQAQPAAAGTPGTPPAAPAAPGTPPAPASPATPEPAPAPATPQAGAPAAYSDQEKEFMDQLPANTKLGGQVKASDPLVQELAQKVMQAAFTNYKANKPR